jgi:hypothetical protein
LWYTYRIFLIIKNPIIQIFISKRTSFGMFTIKCTVKIADSQYYKNNFLFYECIFRRKKSCRSTIKVMETAKIVMQNQPLFYIKSTPDNLVCRQKVSIPRVREKSFTLFQCTEKWEDNTRITPPLKRLSFVK